MRHVALAVWQRLRATWMEDAACGYVDRARHLAGEAHPAACRSGANPRHRGDQRLRIGMARLRAPGAPGPVVWGWRGSFRTCWVGPISTIRPRYMTAVRRHR